MKMEGTPFMDGFESGFLKAIRQLHRANPYKIKVARLVTYLSRKDIGYLNQLREFKEFGLIEIKVRDGTLCFMLTYEGTNYLRGQELRGYI